MDALADMHEEFLDKVTKLCLLDQKSKELNDYIQKVLQVSLEFRYLCIKYFLDRGEINAKNNDEDDLGFREDEVSIREDSKVFGKGLMKVNSPYFIDNMEECNK